MNSIPESTKARAREFIGCGGEGGGAYPLIDLKDDNTTFNSQTGNIDVEFGPETSAKVMECSESPILFKIRVSLDEVQAGSYMIMQVLCLPVSANGDYDKIVTFHYGFTIDIGGGRMKAACTSLSADNIPAGLSINDIEL